MITEPLEFEEDINEADADFPVIAPCIGEVEIMEVTKEENKAHNGYNIVVKHETTAELEAVDGKPIKARSKLTRWFPCQSADKKTGKPTDDWKNNLANLIDCTLGTSKGDRPPLKEALNQLEGKKVHAQFRVGDFNGVPKSEISRYVKVDQAA